MGHLAGGGVSTATQARASVVTRASRDAIPVVIAYAPFGLALGATLAATHIPPLIAWSSSPLVFGGAAQLLAVQLLDTGTSRPAYAAAATGGFVAVVASGLPLELGLLAGAAAGIAVGGYLAGRHG